MIIQSYTLKKLSSTELMLPIGATILTVLFIEGDVRLIVKQNTWQKDRIQRIFTCIFEQMEFEDTELITHEYVGSVVADINTLHIFEIQW